MNSIECYKLSYKIKNKNENAGVNVDRMRSLLCCSYSVRKRRRTKRYKDKKEPISGSRRLYMWACLYSRDPAGGDVSTASLENKHQNVKMAPRSVIKGVLLVSFSVFLTLVLGVGLPALLNALMRLLGLPETSVSECIVLLYLCFVLCVATPRVPRGFEKVVFLTRK